MRCSSRGGSHSGKSPASVSLRHEERFMRRVRVTRSHAAQRHKLLSSNALDRRAGGHASCLGGVHSRRPYQRDVQSLVVVPIVSFFHPRDHMKRSSAFTILLRSGGIAAMVALTAAQAQGQATITGKVTGSDGKPLGGAQVVIRELASYGATTGASGTYTIVVGADKAKGQSLTLVARMPTKSPAIKAITLNQGSQEVNFTLRDDPLRLDELVVTGVNEATSTKKLAFAVGKVSADQIQDVPGTTALGALAGKVAGVRVIDASGDPAGAPAIRLRGATSISGSSNPLIIIDGTISRATLADIASEDIERIEVIKGAAASSLYGSDAANGVIQIFTKRGKNLADGKLLVTTRNEVGASFVTKRIPNSNATNFEVEPDPAHPDTIRFVRTSSGSRGCR